jgi:cell wall assembly regulator SMI1
MSVKTLLLTLRKALGNASLPLAAQLSKAASLPDVAALEAAFGRGLPDDLKAFYATTNGDGSAIEAEDGIRGLLLGATSCAEWIRSMRWVSADEARMHLYECRDTFDAAFRASWLPFATDDCGNVAIVDAADGSVYGIEAEDPRKKDENRIASSIEELLQGLVRDLESGTIQCDKTGFYRVVASAKSPTEPAAMLLALLVDRQLVELVPGCSMDDAVKAVRKVLAGEGSTASLAQELGEVLDSAPWVDETFASDEVLELLVREFR